jgi:drug/metabolite transporter (DMT)-like permease
LPVYNQRRATLLALVAVGLWSTVATAFKLSLRHLDPFQLVAYATLFATLILVAGVSRKHPLNELWSCFAHQPQLFVLLGLLNPCVYYLILFQAYDLLPAQQAQSINYTWAITLGLLSIAFLNRPYGAGDGVGGLLGYAGVLIIATRGDLMSLDFDSPAGVALALLSTLIWATYWILNTRMQADPLLGLSLCFLCGLPFTVLACAVFSDFGPVNLSALLGAAYVGLFEMGITYVIWLSALKTARNIAKISNLIFLSPFLSLMLISQVLDETIVPATFAGLALIVTGTLVQQLWRRSE